MKIFKPTHFYKTPCYRFNKTLRELLQIPYFYILTETDICNLHRSARFS